MIAVSIHAKVMMAIFVIMTIVFTANSESPPRNTYVDLRSYGRKDCPVSPACCCDSCYPCCDDNDCFRSDQTRITGYVGRSDNLLIGKLISQGASRSEVLGAARLEGVRTGQIENVQGKEVAESARQHIEPGNELEVGNLVKEFKQNPMDNEVERAVGSLRYVERKKGKVLDFETGKYVPNPVKVLAEIKASGGDIDTVEGEVVAGDAADVDVVSMKDDLPQGPKPQIPSLTLCCINNGVPPYCLGLCMERPISSRHGSTVGLKACAKFENEITRCQLNLEHKKSGDVAGRSGDGPQSRCSFPYDCLDDPSCCGGK